MSEYRKKPVVIEAKQWTGTEECLAEMLAFIDLMNLPDDGVHVGTGLGFTPTLGTLDIPTLEGVMTASPGDWIIKGFAGEFYPIKDSIFRETYEEATDRPLRVEVYERVDVITYSGVSETEYRWRVVHTSNGEVMASGEGYADRRDRDHAIEVLFPGVEIVEVEG